MENWIIPIPIAHGEGRGSPFGITGLTTEDGRVLILMPHPERAFRMLQNTWKKPVDGDGYWMQMFRNAREFAG